MSTTVTFASHLTGDPELLHSRDGQPFVACRVVVNGNIQNEAGEWVDGKPTGHSVTICGTAANHFYDSAGRGDRGEGHGQLRGEAWRDGEKRTKQVEIVGTRFGECLFLKYGVPHMERPTAPAAATEN